MPEGSLAAPLFDAAHIAYRLVGFIEPCQPIRRAAAGGALGETLVSGALWGPWWQVPAWIAALVATAIAPTLALSGQPLGFMVGWSLFWGLLIGAVAMWGAQLDGAGWAYGIAGGIGFFVGTMNSRLFIRSPRRRGRAALVALQGQVVWRSVG
jgi:hypothetical protein